MMQSKKSETRKQIEWELAIQDALQEVFEPHGRNPCKDIRLTNPCAEIPLSEPTDDNNPLLKKYGVDNKKELFKKLYSYDGESWEDMCERIGEEIDNVSEMDYSELELRVISTFLMLIEQLRDVQEKQEDGE